MQREPQVAQQVDNGSAMSGVRSDRQNDTQNKTHPILRRERTSSSHSPTDSVFQAQERERRRISRELHDEIGQGLMTLRLYLGAVVEAADAALRPKAQEAMASLDLTIDGLRRIMSRLSPRPLQELGLVGAIRREANSLCKQSGMKSHLTLPKDWGGLASQIEMAIYRCVQEGLHNIAKHSGARNFGIVLERSGPTLCVRIDDDGAGLSAKVSHTESFGVLGMRERIEELGGTLKIRTRKTGGTRIEISLPVADEQLSNEPARAS